MSTTYTNNLRLAEMVSGEEDSTWGDIARDNDLKLAWGVTGLVSLTMASSDVTLDTANGGDGVSTTPDDEAAAMILLCGGTISANIDIIAPNLSKMYIVKNDTTQTVAETVSIKTSGGSALEIPNGETYLVWCDGSDGFFTLNAAISGTVALASNSLQLGGFNAVFYSRLAIKNSWTRPQTELANVRTLTALAYTPGAAIDGIITIRQAELTGDITINNPTGSELVDGQVMIFNIEQHAVTPVSVTWGSEYLFPDDTNIDLTQTIDRVDKFTMQYDLGLDRWLVAGIALNFPRS
jgi:hypothetical protein